MSHVDVLAELVERLRAAEFQITPDDYLRATKIIEGAEQLPVERIGTLLGPLFADNREQQERFGKIFSDLIAPQARGPVEPPPEPPRRSPLLATFLATIFAFGILLVWHTHHPTEVKKSPQSPPPATDTATTTFRVPISIPIDEWSPPAIAAALAAAALGALAAVLLARQWRRRTSPSRAPEAGPPFRWNLEVSGTPVLFGAEALARLSRSLRGKMESESIRLDLRRTLATAVSRPAEPQLVFSAELQAPEYVVLIEKRSDRDHHAAYFERLVTLLAADGVELHRYFFDYDPRFCWRTARRSRVPLADIHRRWPQARLIIFGRPRALFDAVTGEVDRGVLAQLRWPVQAIVAADEDAPTIPHLPAFAGPDALTSFAEFFSAGYRDRKPRVASRAWADPVERLSPSARRLLAACAAYPRLQWELTIALGAAISASALPAAILELIALPWFREGEIPDQERTKLLEQLTADPELERCARAVILDLLGKTALPPGSFAAREKDLQVLTQEVWLHREDRPQLRMRYERLREYRLAEIGRDTSLLRLLLTAPGTRLAHRIPQGLRRLWFRFGIPAMGRREVHGIPAALCVAALILAVVPPERLMRKDPARTLEVMTDTVYPVDTMATDTSATTDTMSVITDTTSVATDTSSSTDTSAVSTMSTLTETTGTMAVDTALTGTASIYPVSTDTFATTPSTTETSVTTGTLPVTTIPDGTTASTSRSSSDSVTILNPSPGLVMAGSKRLVTLSWRGGASATQIWLDTLGNHAVVARSGIPAKSGFTTELSAGDYAWTLLDATYRELSSAGFKIISGPTYEDAFYLNLKCASPEPQTQRVSLNLERGLFIRNVQLKSVEPAEFAKIRIKKFDSRGIDLEYLISSPCRPNPSSESDTVEIRVIVIITVGQNSAAAPR